MKNRVFALSLVAALAVAGLAQAFIFGPTSPASFVQANTSTFTAFHAIGTSGAASCQQYHQCTGMLDCPFFPSGWYELPNTTYMVVNLKLPSQPTDLASYKFNLQNADGSVTAAGDMAADHMVSNADGSLTVWSPTYTHPGGYREARVYVKGNTSYTPNSSNIFSFGVATSCAN